MKTIFILRKPLEGNLVKNTLTHGCGGLNIDAARLPTTDNLETHSRGADAAKSKGIYGDSRAQETHQTEGQTLGRFPANFILTHLDACELICVESCSVKGLDNQSGNQNSGKAGVTLKNTPARSWFIRPKMSTSYRIGHGDSGGASRFFKTIKKDNG